CHRVSAQAVVHAMIARWLVVLAGCGRVHFDPSGDALGDGTGGPDAAPLVTCTTSQLTNAPGIEQARWLTVTQNELALAYFTGATPNYTVELARVSLDGTVLATAMIEQGDLQDPTLTWADGELGVVVTKAAPGYEVFFAARSPAGVLRGTELQLTS